MPVILRFFIARVFYSRYTAHAQSNWQWRDLLQIGRPWENHKKRIERSGVWRKTHFL